MKNEGEKPGGWEKGRVGSEGPLPVSGAYSLSEVASALAPAS